MQSPFLLKILSVNTLLVWVNIDIRWYEKSKKIVVGPVDPTGILSNMLGQKGLILLTLQPHILIL